MTQCSCEPTAQGVSRAPQTDMYPGTASSMKSAACASQELALREHYRKTMNKTANKAKLDGATCPICAGWNCTTANPHLAWVLGTSQNLLIAADRAARTK